MEVEAVEGGERRVLRLCERDHARLSAGDPLGPWDLWDEFFFPRRWRDREAADIGAYLSDHPKELLQRAARVAVDYGKREMDTEHVLYAITESEVVREILREFKLSPEDIRGSVEHNAPRGTFRAEKGQTVKVGMSPRAKAVLEAAFHGAQELGHS